MNCKTLCLLLALTFGLNLLQLKAQDNTTTYSSSIFDQLNKKGPKNNTVSLNQNQSIKNCINAKVSTNRSTSGKMTGFRIRLYFDNQQNARQESAQVMYNFQELYPQTGAYREYEDPYFKVTVGDFRTKSEAMQFLKNIQAIYPAAFLTKETINFPAL